ncbi:hypothetical protein A3A39_04790 [Candidatus Kaiserbacteria bacterium RIFCSPLOWO2_01_FULL_54_13]|uniref:Uncharacterized protein n=1 Tax=Candidatus Kaiserbacteria bacterium RIFCSPLOWO2_01_FULL_54_13 TaxID=1798512 RepID=A0A1F6F0R1_9BACT|nr:MAG: hypothetical protein A3A39_04790 [Candidatus Kaiserbacteria bacterium RIFCSPLOWO2_01_FULL_54_13]
MKLWIPSIAILLLIGGVLFFEYDDLKALDPFRVISTPPVPEPEASPPAGGFVPTSGEVSQRIERTSLESDEATPHRIGAEEVCGGADSSNFDCYEKHYVTLVDEKGIAAAFTDLKARYDGNGYVVSQCHPITHVIGREAALSFATPGEAYTQGDSFCWSGYYHGVLETFLEKVGRENLPKEIDHICDGIEGKERYSFDYYNCVHGLGHGVMAITDTELFESLAYCDFLTGDWEQKSCGSGVYMENVIVDNLNHFTKYLRPEEPLYPCTASPEKYKETCYLMQTSYVLKVNGGNFPDPFAWCRKAEEPHRATCFQSLGRDASGRTSSDAQGSKRICLMGENFFERSNCVIGAVKDFISYFHSDAQAGEFCELFGEEPELVSTCRSTATTYYAQF